MSNRVGYDAAAGLHRDDAVLLRRHADGDAGVHVAGEVKIAERTAVHAARLAFLLLDDLARADFRRTGQRSCREHRLDGVTGVELFVDVALDLRADVHDLRVAVDHHIFGDFDRTDLRYAAEVVSSEVHEHIVLGKLLFVREKLALQRLVLV